MSVRKRLIFLLALALGLFSQAGQAASHSPEQLNVGYFKQWPTPNLFSLVKQTYDRALGIPVNWVPFSSGSAMNDAMAAGELDIAFAQGHVPFLLGVTGGLDLTLVGIAVGYSRDDNCVVRDGLGISGDTPQKLAGNKIATVDGGVTHYRLLKMLDHLKVGRDSVEILALEDGGAVVSALRNGEVAMGCAYGSSLRAMLDLGQPLLGGRDLEAIGLPVFDVISAPTGFVNEHPGLVQTFMDVTEATNSQWRQNPAPMRSVIARAAGMDRYSSDNALARFSFPSASEQRSEAWLGGTVPIYLKAIADFFVEQGRLRESLESYDRFVSTRFLR